MQGRELVRSTPGPPDSAAPHGLPHGMFQPEDLKATSVSETAWTGDSCMCREGWLQPGGQAGAAALGRISLENLSFAFKVFQLIGRGPHTLVGIISLRSTDCEC